MKDKIHSKLIEYGTAIGEESRIELVNELFDLFGVSHRREQLEAIEDLKEWAYDNCNSFTQERLNEIIERL
tara:strand:+ start:181 stop:393 length:213 start_codon:yes stop_codon:yes gene_type:complete